MTPPFPAPAPVAASTPATRLHQLLGLSDGRDLRIQDMAGQIRSNFKLQGVLIATSDGLPLVKSLPAEIDADKWSGLGPRLFRRFGGEGDAVSWGRPGRCLLSFNDSWITILHEGDIYLILSHELEAVTVEFEDRNQDLARELARYCESQKSPTGHL